MKNQRLCPLYFRHIHCDKIFCQKLKKFLSITMDSSYWAASPLPRVSPIVLSVMFVVSPTVHNPG